MSGESSKLFSQKVLDLLLKYVTVEEDQIRLFCFLADCKNPRFVQILEAFSSEERTFAKTVKKLVEVAKCLEDDKDFYIVMNELWNNYLKPDNSSNDVAIHFDAGNLMKSMSTKDASVVTCALLELIVRLPLEKQQEIIAAIGRLTITNQQSLVRYAGSLVSLRATGGKVVSFGLVACTLTLEALQSLRSWWNGEISGKRCVKNIIDSTAGCVVGVGGGYVGAFFGNMLIPGAGAIVGGLLGGVISANVANSLSDWLTQKLFGLPKEVALENAFNFFGLPVDSSNDAINSKYREMVLRYHPDKGGSREDWDKLQFALALIKVSRE